MRYLKMTINIKTYLCYFLFYLIIVFVLSGCSAEERCEYLVVEKENNISVLYGTTAVDCSSLDISANIRFIEYSRNRKAVAFVTEEGELYYSYEGDKLQYIADGMPGRAGGGYLFEISDNGEVLTYFNKEGIHLYSEGTDEIIDTVGKEYYIHRLALSPDGKTVGYSYLKNGDFDFFYVYNNGKRTKMLKGCIQSVSDNGEVVYYSTFENGRCINVIYNLDINTSKKFSDGYSISVSSDCKDIIYNNAIRDTCIYHAFDDDASIISHKDYWIIDNCVDYENFDDFLLYNRNDLCRVIKEENAYKIYEYENMNIYFDEYVLADDKRRLIYTNAWKESKQTSTYETGWKSSRTEVAYPFTDYETVELHFIDTSFEDSKSVLLANDLREINEYGTDKKFEHIYYINVNNELVCIKGFDGKKTVIDKNVHSMAVTPDGVCVYICDYGGDEGVLCFSVSGGEGKEAEIEGKAESIYVYGDCVAITNADRIYASNDGINYCIAK